MIFFIIIYIKSNLLNLEVLFDPFKYDLSVFLCVISEYICLWNMVKMHCQNLLRIISGKLKYIISIETLILNLMYLNDEIYLKYFHFKCNI